MLITRLSPWQNRILYEGVYACQLSSSDWPSSSLSERATKCNFVHGFTRIFTDFRIVSCPKIRVHPENPCTNSSLRQAASEVVGFQEDAEGRIWVAVNLGHIRTFDRADGLPGNEFTSNKEIAKELSITERTVKYHIGLILERLQLRSRYELARYAQEQGFTGK